MMGGVIMFIVGVFFLIGGELFSLFFIGDCEDSIIVDIVCLLKIVVFLMLFLVIVMIGFGVL